MNNKEKYLSKTMIEVFKTNIKYQKDACQIQSLLEKKLKNHNINFDLEDCDNILRIETANGKIAVSSVEKILQDEGFFCEVLSD